jgi:hypothetical protein
MVVEMHRATGSGMMPQTCAMISRQREKQGNSFIREQKICIAR